MVMLQPMFAAMSVIQSTVQAAAAATTQAAAAAAAATHPQPPPTYPTSAFPTATPQPTRPDWPFPPAVKIPHPPFYDGRSKKACRPWLNTVRTWMQVTRMDLDSIDCVRLASTFLTDAAQDWFQSRMLITAQEEYADTTAAGYANFDEFAFDLERALGDPYPELKARKDLHRLTQRTSVMEYASQFQRIVAHIPTTDPAHLLWKFLDGLKPDLQKLLLGKTEGMQKWQDVRDLAHRFDSLVMDSRHKAYPDRRPAYPVNTTRDNRRDDPMDLSAAHVPSRSPSVHRRPPTPGPNRGRSPAPSSSNTDRPRLAKLTPEERDRCIAEGRCLRCRKLGHFASTCPLNPDNARGRSPNPRVPKN